MQSATCTTLHHIGAGLCRLRRARFALLCYVPPDILPTYGCSQADGTAWEFTANTPGHYAFSTSVPFTHGAAAAQYGYRQRPHVVLTPAGHISHLITGVVFDSSRC